MISNNGRRVTAGFITCCLSLLVALLVVPQSALSQKIKNNFFPLHNIIRGDSVYNTYDKQVALIKNAGYDGIEISQLESFEGMKEALDKYHFKGSYFYVKLNLDDPHVDPRLKSYIHQLKGSGTVIAPYIISDSKKYINPSPEADSVVVRQMNQLGDWAREAGLQVAIYPHFNYYVQHLNHTLDLVRKINRKNVGLSFNLCHWLATTNADDRKSLRKDLMKLSPHLKLVTICGANDVITQKQKAWDDYILPLGTGDFDTFGLIRYIIRDLKYKGPVGAQCYAIKRPKIELVQNTVKVWKEYKTRLEAEN